MKIVTLSATALMLLGTLTLGMADDISVDEQITAIQEAPAGERVQMMNQFKQRLATMNEADREAAITQLRTQTQTRTQARVESGEATGEQLQTRTQTQTRSRVNEMQQTQQMEHGQQQMQQQQQQMQQMQQQTAETALPNLSRNGQ